MKKLINFLTAASIIIPMIVLLEWSFSNVMPWPDLLPDKFSLNSWSSIINQSEIIRSIMISVFISFAVTILVLFISIPCAAALSLYSPFGKEIIWIFIIAPFIIPYISLCIGLHYVFLSIGLTDSYAGVIVSHIIPSLPYAVKILYSGFEFIGKEMGEQAVSLGASFRQVFLLLYLPLLKPAILLSSLLVFIISFSQYMLTFLIGGGAVKTLPILLFPVIQNGSRTEASVYSFIFIISALSASLIMEKLLSNKINSKYYI